MKSYTKLRNLYGTLTKNTTAANLTLGDELINDEYRHICAFKDFYFLHRIRTLNTVGGTQFLDLPYDVDQVESVYVTISNIRYTPKLIMSREQWDILNRTPYSSDIPRFAFVYNGQIGLWPKPSSNGNVITINAKIRVIDLSAADYSAGNIASVTNGATTVTGGSTSWTERMIGRWIRMTYSDTANTGDGEWYEIAGVASGTSLSLVRSYGGTSITAGSAAYAIGQMPLLPEDFHDTPVYKAAATYWYTNGDMKRGDAFQQKYDADIDVIKKMRTAPVTDHVVYDGISDGYINPNLTVML